MTNKKCLMIPQEDVDHIINIFTYNHMNLYPKKIFFQGERYNNVCRCLKTDKFRKNKNYCELEIKKNERFKKMTNKLLVGMVAIIIAAVITYYIVKKRIK